jgi:anaerobic magnesium-protoporphyrin IX monomethyl ester cyclase
MRILFVYTLEVSQSSTRPIALLEWTQFGISYISAYLQQSAHQTRLLVLTRKSPFDSIDRLLSEFQPELVAFTAVSSEYLFVEQVGQYIKARYPGVFLLAGGAHVSLAPDEAMLETFDALCIGEGEQPTLELITCLERGQPITAIPNLWVKADGKIHRNPTRPFLQDLDALPFPDRRMWQDWVDTDFYPDQFRPAVLLGRGCPFICTYCSNHALKELASGTYVRLRSPENIAAEVRSVAALYPQAEEIYLEIETFGADLAWAHDLCTQLAALNASRHPPLRFGVNLRIYPKLIEKLEPLFQDLRTANFSSINIGLESGSERVRKQVLRRNYSNHDVAQAVATAKKYGLKVSFFNIVGLPTETIEDFNETVRMNRLCQPDHHYTSIFYPYPGTDLYHMCESQGLLPADHLASGMERVKADLDLPQFSQAQIQKAYIWFDYYVFKGLRPISQLARRILEQYFTVYKGKSRLRLPFTFFRDVFSPALRLDKSYQEYKLILGILPALVDELRRNGIRKVIYKFKK